VPGARYLSYVDLQERYQLDMAARMQKVRRKARPWRSIFALVIALAAAGVAIRYGHGTDKNATTTARTIVYSSAAAFFFFGLVATFGLSGQARSSLRPVIGQAHAAVLRYATVLISLFILLVGGLELVGVSPRQLVVGGAVTGVLLGIAAQQSLANLFAGLVLLFARPFRVGDRVRFRAGALSGQIDGLVVDISLTYVRLETEDGLVMLPNAQVLAAAVVMLKPPAEGTGATGLSAPAPVPGYDAGPGRTGPGGTAPSGGTAPADPGGAAPANAAGPAPAGAGPPV
jgi:small-conductance mechanosensitive channel